MYIKVGGGGEMAQSGECLSCKHEDLMRASTWKPGTVWIWSPGTKELETARRLSNISQSVYLNHEPRMQGKTLSQKVRFKFNEEDTIDPCPQHVYTYTHMHTHMHTHTPLRKHTYKLDWSWVCSSAGKHLPSTGKALCLALVQTNQRMEQTKMRSEHLLN